MSEIVAALVGAAVGGAIAIFTSWITSRAAAKEAAESRRQTRIEGAYLQLLEVVNLGWKIAETDALDKPAPDYQSVNIAVATVWVQMGAFASPSVLELFNAWRKAWMFFEMDMHNERLRLGSSAPEPDVRKRLVQLRNDVIGAAEHLQERIAAELRGEK